MVSYPPSTLDGHDGRSEAGNHGHGRMERTPGTPRKEGREVREKAMQDPGLKDYVCLNHKNKGTWTNGISSGLESALAKELLGVFIRLSIGVLVVLWP